jgi:glycosyltransferase involved in cell wall biosynthesis
MKLLYYNIELPYVLKDSEATAGGAAIEWKSWIRGFTNSGHEFGILTWKGARKYINKKLDIDIVESYDPDYGIRKIRLLYHKLPKLFFAVKKYNPDYLIQGSAQQYTGILMIISKLLGIKFIHRIAHDAHIDHRISEMINSKFNISLYQIGLKYADFIFAQNSYQYEKLLEKYPQKKIFILHNPFEIEHEKTTLLRMDRKYVAWVGNFRNMKNLPALFKIAHDLPKVKFKIAGNSHKDIDRETKNAVASLKGLENVEFVGYLKRDEINSFFLKAIALLNTSHYEGFSNTFLEAWSCGTPVISTKNVNPDGIITKYEVGKVAEQYEKLSKCVEDIMSLDEKKYNELSLNCFKYVKENHDPQKLAEKFILCLIQN